MNDFDKALELLHERGWYQGMLESSDGRLCLVGTLDRATSGQWIPSEWDMLIRVACQLFPKRGADAPAINDHKDTTLEDIELILKHASYEWEQQHNHA